MPQFLRNYQNLLSTRYEVLIEQTPTKTKLFHDNYLSSTYRYYFKQSSLIRANYLRPLFVSF